MRDWKPRLLPTRPGGVSSFRGTMGCMKTADAEQAKSSGGMVALLPSEESLDKLWFEGTTESRDDIHLTLGYLGEDVSHLYSPVAAQDIVDNVGSWYGKIAARVFAHATFNPDGFKGRETCAVYLIGDNAALPSVYDEVQQGLNAMYEIPDQHTPWIPHITAGYGMTAADLSFVGEVVFDRIVLTWMGESHVVSLNGGVA